MGMEAVWFQVYADQELSPNNDEAAGQTVILHPRPQRCIYQYSSKNEDIN
jgi:hypothetical protein